MYPEASYLGQLPLKENECTLIEDEEEEKKTVSGIFSHTLVYNTKLIVRRLL